MTETRVPAIRTDTPPTDTRTLYADLATRMAGVTDAVPEHRWSTPSPCKGWSAADVVHHLIDTQARFLAERGMPVPKRTPADGPAAAWRTHARSVAAVLAPADVAETAAYDGFFGPSTVGESLAMHYGFDMIVHRWDVARASGQHTEWTAEELQQVEKSIEAFGEHLHMEGICGPEVAMTGPVTRQEQLLAKTGRDPRWAAD